MATTRRKWATDFWLRCLFGLVAAIGTALGGGESAATADLVSQLSGQIDGSTVREIGNLGPHTGWVRMGNKLFMTANDGRSWTDITPPSKGHEPIDRVNFLDTMNGWVLKTKYKTIQENDVLGILVCHTADGGKTWSCAPILVAHPSDVQQFSGEAAFQFADSQTGWLTLARFSSAEFRTGQLLSTTDGGATWTRKSVSYFGTVSFPSSNVGWLAGGPGGESLYQTLDGGVSWSEITIPLPAGIASDWRPRVYPPRFSDAAHGVLPILYVSPKGDGFASVLFQTNNAGASWTPKNIKIARGIVHSVIITSSQQPLLVDHIGNILSIMAADGSGAASSYTVANTTVFGEYFDIPSASFSANNVGWVLLSHVICQNGGPTCKGTDSVLSTTTAGRRFAPIVLPAPAASRHPRLKPVTVVPRVK